MLDGDGVSASLVDGVIAGDGDDGVFCQALVRRWWRTASRSSCCALTSRSAFSSVRNRDWTREVRAGCCWLSGTVSACSRLLSLPLLSCRRADPGGWFVPTGSPLCPPAIRLTVVLETSPPPARRTSRQPGNMLVARAVDDGRQCGRHLALGIVKRGELRHAQALARAAPNSASSTCARAAKV